MPQASVYPRRMRATRVLLRHSHHRLRTRGELYSHIQHTASQDHLGEPIGRIAKPQNRRGLIERFAHACVRKHMAGAMALVDGDDPPLAELERSSEKTAHNHAPVSLARLRPIPGVGNLLALVLLYERTAIARCPRVQACVSYGRLVQSAKGSNGQRDGTSGTKIGNAPLTWAFSEAAGRLLTPHEPAQQHLTKLATRHGTGKALAILAHQLGRAVYGRRKPHAACDQELCLAPEGGRERTSLASNWSHRGSGT